MGSAIGWCPPGWEVGQSLVPPPLLAFSEEGCGLVVGELDLRLLDGIRDRQKGRGH